MRGVRQVLRYRRASVACTRGSATLWTTGCVQYIPFRLILKEALCSGQSKLLQVPLEYERAGAGGVLVAAAVFVRTIQLVRAKVAQ